MSDQIPGAELPEGNALQEARGVDLLKQAAKKRDEREAHLFLDIPSWDGLLIGEYKILGKKKWRDIAERTARRAVNGDDRTTMDSDIQLIIAAHVGLSAVDPNSGDRVPIEDEFGRVGYDRIAHTLGKQDDPNIQSAADAVRYLTGERDEDNPDEWVENILAIGMHAQAISRWMRDPSKRTVNLEELLGEL